MLDRTSDEQDVNAGGALREALRRARAEAAQQTDVVVDLRAAEIARLELLRDELAPVFAQVPRDIDIFDLGLATGERPRLFVDMVSFVEMGHDRRSYRFLRDGRHGRAVIAESDRADKIVDAVTGYIARRLIERERLLADDDRIAGLGAPTVETRPESVETSPPPAAPPTEPVPLAGTAVEEPLPVTEPSAAPAAPVQTRSGWSRLGRIMLAFAIGAAIGGLGVVAGLLAVANGLIPI